MRMAMTRRALVEGPAAAAVTRRAAAAAELDAFVIAQRHGFQAGLPTPGFFEGMLLGNGDIGLCITVRPDALGLHIGKLDVWDIRVSEEHEQAVQPLAGVLKLWKEAGEAAKKEGEPERIFLENRPPLSDYVKKVRSSYEKPWPRPWPCGTLWVHWDPREVRVERQELDISCGLYTLRVLAGAEGAGQSAATLRCFVSRENGHISIDADAPFPAVSIAYFPHRDARARMPAPRLEALENGFFCHQRLPATAPTEGEAEEEAPPGAGDRLFALAAVWQGGFEPSGQEGVRRVAAARRERSAGFRVDLALWSSLDHPGVEEQARREAARLSRRPPAGVFRESEGHWREFWSKSAVAFDDRALERIWYRNQYLLACCLKPGKVAPGMFGNWPKGNIGTAWHGDYHMNYNTQHVWWGVFSSNHAEQHEPYVRLVESLMPMAQWNARVQFGLPGAYFPHSAYPAASRVNPYPAPPGATRSAKRRGPCRACGGSICSRWTKNICGEYIR